MNFADWESVDMDGHSRVDNTSSESVYATDLHNTDSVCEEVSTTDLDSNVCDRVLETLSTISWCMAHHSFTLSRDTYTSHQIRTIKTLRPGISRTCLTYDPIEPLSTRISNWVEWHIFERYIWTYSHQDVWDDCVKNSPSVRFAIHECQVGLLSPGERLFYDHDSIWNQNGFIWIPVRFCGGVRECTELWVLVCVFTYAGPVGSHPITALPRFDVDMYPLLWKLVLDCFHSSAEIIAKSDDNMLVISTH